MYCSIVSLGILFSSHFLSNFTFELYMSAIVSFNYLRVRILYYVTPIGPATFLPLGFVEVEESLLYLWVGFSIAV